MTTTEQTESITFPPGFNGRTILRSLNHPAWMDPDHNGAYYRRGVTRGSPVRFALTYLSPYLREQETGVLSFSRMHLDLAHEAISWMPDPRGIRHPRKDVWIAPRGAAKSIWSFVVLPLWALAHGHRRFFMAFSASAGQAIGHLAKIRRQLDTNELLLNDFPHLAPAGHKGARNTHQTVTTGGATLAAHGMGEKTLGITSDTLRPDLVIGDDLEPGEADYSPEAKIKQLSRLINNVLPMGARSTVVQLNGTTTMYGSIIHDAVRHALGEQSAPWIVENDFHAHYYEPIVTDPDGTRRSMWPQRWTLTELEAMEGTRSYELNYLNNPSPGGTSTDCYFTQGLFRYSPVWAPVRRVLSIDIAVTKKVTSDYTALAVVSGDSTGTCAMVEHAESGKLSGGQIRERVFRLAAEFPRSLHDVILESNQGGELWSELLEPMPRGVTLHLRPETKNKKARTMALLDQYEAKAVWHHHRLPALEEQLRAWPNVRNDDLIDAASAGIAEILEGAA